MSKSSLIMILITILPITAVQSDTNKESNLFFQENAYYSGIALSCNAKELAEKLRVTTDMYFSLQLKLSFDKAYPLSKRYRELAAAEAERSGQRDPNSKDCEFWIKRIEEVYKKAFAKATGL